MPYTWKKTNMQLKKVVYALTESNVKRLIEWHEIRGWRQASKIQPHGNGYGCLMTFKRGE